MFAAARITIPSSSRFHLRLLARTMVSSHLIGDVLCPNSLFV